MTYSIIKPQEDWAKEIVTRLAQWAFSEMMIRAARKFGVSEK